MNIINRIMKFIKNIFKKQEEVKQIEAPKMDFFKKQEEEFLKSIRVDIAEKKENRKIETRICPGDGLGIKKKMSS